MYKRASNTCVNFFLAWVKYVPNFTLFCRESELSQVLEILFASCSLQDILVPLNLFLNP